MTFQLLIFPDQTQLSLVKHEKGWIEFLANSYPQISYWVDLPKTFSMAPLAEMKPQNGLTRENVGDDCDAIQQCIASKYETIGGSYPAFQLNMQSLQKETKLPPKNRDFHKNIIGTQASKYLVEYTVTKKH